MIISNPRLVNNINKAAGGDASLTLVCESIIPYHCMFSALKLLFKAVKLQHYVLYSFKYWENPL